MSIDATALTGRGNYYEDFAVGDVYEHARGKTIEALENVLLTNLVLNTAQIHFNEDLAERIAAQKHRIVFGGVTASLVIGLAMQDTGEQAVEEVALDKVRFRISVIHGDTLYAFSEVLGKNDSAEVLRGHREVGEVHFKHWGVNQRGETVFEGERRVLIKKRSFSTAGLEIEDETAASRVRQRMKSVGSSRSGTRGVVRVLTMGKKSGAPKSAKPAASARGLKSVKADKDAKPDSLLKLTKPSGVVKLVKPAKSRGPSGGKKRK
jgi:itaconyl-CoA hydratase